MADEPYKNPEWLRDKYHKEGLTGKEMADKAGCARTTIYKYMREFGISRDRGEGYRPVEPEKYRDETWLRQKYHGEKLSTAEIGEVCDCSKQTIKLWLERHSIEKRSKSEAAKIRADRYPETVPDGDHIKDYNWWAEATKEEKDEFRERLSEQRKGEDNPMWGVTGEDHHNYEPDKAPYGFYQSKEWKKTRQQVLERDGHKCQACGATEDLHVHHIIPVSAGGERYDIDNLVTLCDTHHREWEGLYLRPDTRGVNDD